MLGQLSASNMTPNPIDYVPIITTKWNDTDGSRSVFFWAAVCVIVQQLLCGLCCSSLSPYCVKATQCGGILCFGVSHNSCSLRMTAWSCGDKLQLTLLPLQKVKEFRGCHSQFLIGSHSVRRLRFVVEFCDWLCHFWLADFYPPSTKSWNPECLWITYSAFTTKSWNPW